MRELVFATHNKNKLKEIQAMLPSSIRLLSLEDIGCTEEIAETGTTIEENALLKASYIKKKYGYDAFADDTGLEVSALNNAPGVFSARYAGNQKSDADNISLLLKNLEGKENRSAQFKTIISLCIDNQSISFEGIAKGVITKTPTGENGFGYDPIFLPENHSKTFAQLSKEEKNAISHRAKAFEKLCDFMNNFIKKQ